MRTEKKISIFIAIGMIALGAILAFIALMLAKFNMAGLVRTSDYAEKKYDISGDYKEIDLELKEMDLAIMRSEDDETHFTCYENDKTAFQTGISGKKLVITEKLKNNLINFNLGMGPKACVLYLPGDKYEDLDASLGSGDIDISEEFTFDDVKIKTGSGDITLKGIKASDVKIESGTGNVETDGLKCSDGVAIKTGSGDLVLRDTVSDNEFKIKTGTGEVELSSCDGHDIEIDTGSGDVSGTLKTGKNFITKTGAGDVSVPENGGSGTCSVKTGTGDIDLSVQ